MTCRECRSCMTRLNQQPAGAGAAAYRSRRREVILDAQLPPGPRTRQQIRFVFTDIDPPRDDCRPARFRPAPTLSAIAGRLESLHARTQLSGQKV